MRTSGLLGISGRTISSCISRHVVVCTGDSWNLVHAGKFAVRERATIGYTFNLCATFYPRPQHRGEIRFTALHRYGGTGLSSGESHGTLCISLLSYTYRANRIMHLLLTTRGAISGFGLLCPWTVGTIPSPNVRSRTSPSGEVGDGNGG